MSNSERENTTKVFLSALACYQKIKKGSKFLRSRRHPGCARRTSDPQKLSINNLEL